VIKEYLILFLREFPYPIYIKMFHAMHHDEKMNWLDKLRYRLLTGKRWGEA